MVRLLSCCWWCGGSSFGFDSPPEALVQVIPLFPVGFIDNNCRSDGGGGGGAGDIGVQQCQLGGRILCNVFWRNLLKEEKKWLPTVTRSEVHEDASEMNEIRKNQ